jgi:hypothetical protein
LEKERIVLAIATLNQALESLEEGNKLRTLGLLTESREYIKELRWILQDQLDSEKGEE